MINGEDQVFQVVIQDMVNNFIYHLFNKIKLKKAIKQKILKLKINKLFKIYNKNSNKQNKNYL